MTASGRFHVLRRIDFFDGFSDVELWSVVEIATFRFAVEGDVLFREGNGGSEFMVIVQGTVRITKFGRVIDVVSASATLGEVGYVLGDTVARNASCIATDDGVMLLIGYAQLRALTDACRNKFERKFLEILALRLVDINRRVASSS